MILSCHLNGQNNAKIQGDVYDFNKKPLERATISLVSKQDSLVLSYALTDRHGAFELVRVPTERELVLFVSHVNSSLFEKEVLLKPGENIILDSIVMSGNQIEEIVVEGIAPIRLNGDTLEYKADYFKTRPNASVEELLQLLPGLQVNADGTIYYQGREVSGVRVNNKDFFAQDLTIATRNLDASLIDMVQVIKDKGESKREILDDSELPIVLNLKMKEEFLRADFGKFYGGLATRDRYESGALLNTFRDTLQVSFIGFGNNIGRQGFEYSELSQHGGYGRGENMRFTRYGSNGLINQLSAGVNINYDIAKKLKTNLMYNYGQNNFYSDSENKGNSFYDDIREQSQGVTNSETGQFNHELRGFVRYHIDTTAQISYDGRLESRSRNNTNEGSSQSWRNSDQPVLDASYQNHGKGKNSTYRHTIRGEKKFENKWLLSLQHAFDNNYSDNNSRNASVRRYYLFNDSLINQEERTRSHGRRYSINNRLNLQVPIGKKINFDLFSTYNFKNETEEQDINNRLNSEEFINRNDVANNKGLQNHEVYLGTKWNIRLIEDLPVSVGMDWLSLESSFEYFGKRENRNVQNNYWLPNLSITYKDANVSYSRSVNPPSFYSIVAVDSDLYPTSYTLASPYFENIVNDRYNIRYNKFFTKSKINVYIYGQLTRSDQSIGYSRTYNTENSFSTTENYQAGPTTHLYGNINISKTFLQDKDWKLSYALSSHGSNSQSFSTVNGEEGRANSLWGQINNTINLSYKNNLTFSPNYAIVLSQTTFDAVSENFRDVRNFQHNLGITMRLDDIKKFRLETSYTLKNQVVGLNNERNNLHIVNASLYYPILGKGEIKLSAFDILNQNVSNQFFAYQNMNSYTMTTTLRQYFMLGLVYKFLNTGGKK